MSRTLHGTLVVLAVGALLSATFAAITAIHSHFIDDAPAPIAMQMSQSGIHELGLPFEIVVEEEDFVLAYDGRTRQAKWVAERLTRDKILKSDGDREFSKFFEDRRVPWELRASLLDYKGSGYDRGHMAAAGNHSEDQRSIDSTFTLLNMSPQLPNFNRSYWRKVESLVRVLAVQERVEHVHVVSGPLWENMLIDPRSEDVVMHDTIGGSRVGVPTGYFKAIAVKHVGLSTPSVSAYIFPHREIDTATPVSNFVVSTDELERRSGLDFWSKIPSARENSEYSVLRELEDGRD